MEKNGGTAVFVISHMDREVGRYMTNCNLDFVPHYRIDSWARN